MRKLLYSFFAVTILWASGASAATFTGAAAIYEVKLAKVELYNSTTAEWVTVFEGLTEAIDLAEGAPGDAAGDFFSGAVIPDGTYTKAKVTPGTEFVIQGTVGGSHTTSTPFPTGDGNVISTASNVGPEEEAAVTVDPAITAAVGAVEQDFSGTPITVLGGTPDKKVRVLFDLSNALTFDDAVGPTGVIYPNPPVVSVTIN